MDRDTYESLRSTRAAMVLGSCGLFSFAGCGIPVFQFASFGTGHTFTDAGMGVMVGFVAGAVIGLVASWLMLVLSSTNDPDLQSAGPQLVGQTCVSCQKRIGNIAEGRFCPDCRRPTHHRCTRPTPRDDDTQCPCCGIDYPDDETA